MKKEITINEHDFMLALAIATGEVTKQMYLTAAESGEGLKAETVQKFTEFSAFVSVAARDKLFGGA